LIPRLNNLYYPGRPSSRHVVGRGTGLYSGRPGLFSGWKIGLAYGFVGPGLWEGFSRKGTRDAGCLGFGCRAGFCTFCTYAIFCTLEAIVSSIFCSISKMPFGKQVVSSTIYPSPLSLGEGDGDPLQQCVVLPGSQQARIYDFSRLHEYPLTMFIGMPPGWPSRLTS